MGLRITGGRVVDPGNDVDEIIDLYVEDGAVAGLGRAPRAFRADRTIPAKGLIVAPGLVDLCAYLREPGFEHKATIASEARAAVCSGFTTVCCPPDTQPVIDTPAVVELIHHRAKLARAASVVCLGALTQQLAGQVLAEMAALKAIGCVGVSNARMPVKDTVVLRHAMEYAATVGLTVFVQPEDAWLGRAGRMHEGAVSTRLGVPPIPETAETIEVARILLLCEQTGARTHFGRLSAARSLKLINEARRRRLPVSADTGLAYLHMIDADVGEFDAHYHVRPPFRAARDRAALIRGVRNREIEAVCSDHQPHEPDAKAAPFGSTEPGMSGLDTFIPLLLELVARGELSLSRAIEVTSIGPARILDLDVGHLGVGAPADITLIDPKLEWSCDPEAMASAGKNTPLAGRRLVGRAVMTLVAGRVVRDALRNGAR